MGGVRSPGTQIMLTITLYRVFGYDVTSMVLRVSILKLDIISFSSSPNILRVFQCQQPVVISEGNIRAPHTKELWTFKEVYSLYDDIYKRENFMET